MSYTNIVNLEPTVYIETEAGKVLGSVFNDISVTLEKTDNKLNVYITGDTTPLKRVYLKWPFKAKPGVKILGDHWERGYGDLCWRGIVPERVMPWYTMVTEDNLTCGYGVMTGPDSMCWWKITRNYITLCLDTRNGGKGVHLNGNKILAARVLCREGKENETPFLATKAFCEMMCECRRPVNHKVYGSNNWYYAYGQSSHKQIMRDASLLRELTEGIKERPYMVIDDGWQICHNTGFNGGPWDRGNYLFPNIEETAKEIKKLGLKPGIWYRPLYSVLSFPHECVAIYEEGGAMRLDASHPMVLKHVEESTRTLRGMGYELLKHDYTTFDIFGRWGMHMEDSLTSFDKNFYDNTKTNAQIIKTLYETIRRGAGDDTVIIGCNTISHLSAGVFELQRTGDDTSGREWERTRKMGVNTLAFRMPQHKVFYECDADCVGMTGLIDWKLNSQWLKLLSVSGTPLFVSADPDTVTDEQKQALKEAYKTFVNTDISAEPIDFTETTCPEIWKTQYGTMEFDFDE